MTNKTTRAIRVFSPLLLLGLLVLARVGAAEVFLFCQFGGCEPLTANLKSIFLFEKSDQPKPIVTATAEQAPKNETEKVQSTKPETGKTQPSEPKPQETQQPKASPGQQKPTVDEAQRAQIENAAIKSQKYSALITWVFLTLVCAGICLVACWLSSLVILNPIQPNAPKRWGWLTTTASLSAVFWLLLLSFPQFHLVIVREFIGALQSGFSRVALVINLVNSLAFATAAYVTMAIVSILREADAFSPVGRVSLSDFGKKRLETPEAVLIHISRAMKRLQNLLYVATLMLVSGVFLERSIFQWALAFTLRDDNAIKAAQTLIASLVAADGGFYTLALAAVYLPAALILRRKAEQLKGLPQDATEREKVLQANGLNFSFGDSVPKLVAILAPLLVGPVGELFGRLAK